jgi:hypothetical protein
MTSLSSEIEQTARASSVRVTDDAITVELEDGRTVSVPTAWFPRLLHATAKERANYQIDDEGVMWPDVEADFSIRGLLLGRKSGESPECFKFWLDNRKKGRRVTVEQWLNLKRRERRQRRRAPVALRSKRKMAKK